MKYLLPLLNSADKELMENILTAGKIKHKFAVRLQTVLHRASGKATSDIAAFLGIHPVTVSLYVRRYNTGGVDALIRDKTRKPGKEPVSEEKKTELIKMVCTGKPKAATHWSVRSLAKRLGIGKSSVNTILRENGLKPRVSQKFGFSTDKQFEEKLKDVVGLYMNPPDNAVILCVDEKSRIQAPERSQPVLPMFRKGRPRIITGTELQHCLTL